MVLRRRGSLVAMAIYPTEEADGTITLGFADGTPSAVKALARNCRYLAALRGDDSCSIEVPSSYFPKLVEGADYKRKESTGMVVMQYAGEFGERASRPVRGHRRVGRGQREKSARSRASMRSR